MNKNNNYLFACVLRILKARIDKAHSPQTKSALIFAHNLLVYALRNDVTAIEAAMKKEGL
jgi:hypothetical protein